MFWIDWALELHPVIHEWHDAVIKTQNNKAVVVDNVWGEQGRGNVIFPIIKPIYK